MVEDNVEKHSWDKNFDRFFKIGAFKFNLNELKMLE